MVLLTRSNVISVVETMSLTKLYHDMAADIDMGNTNNLRLTYFCTKLMFRCTSSTIFSRLVCNTLKKDYYIHTFFLIKMYQVSIALEYRSIFSATF